jgi:hypothetical protein
MSNLVLSSAPAAITIASAAGITRLPYFRAEFTLFDILSSEPDTREVPIEALKRIQKNG